MKLIYLFLRISIFCHLVNIARSFTGFFGRTNDKLKQCKYDTNVHLKRFALNANNNFIMGEGSVSPCRIKVIGVGGGGGNAINRMVTCDASIEGVEMWAVNTDPQALAKNSAPNKLNIGSKLSRYGIYI